MLREGFLDEVVLELHPKGWVSFREVDIFVEENYR